MQRRAPVCLLDATGRQDPTNLLSSEFISDVGWDTFPLLIPTSALTDTLLNDFTTQVMKCCGEKRLQSQLDIESG